MIVPAGRLEAVNVATPSSSVAVPIAPFWSLKVTVPPVGVAPPAVKSLTVAVKVGSPEIAEAMIAVRVGRALNRRAVRGRRPGAGNRREIGARRPSRSPAAPRGTLFAPKATGSRGGTAIGSASGPNGSAERESGFDKRSVARSWSGVVMVNALPGALPSRTERSSLRKLLMFETTGLTKTCAFSKKSVMPAFCSGAPFRERMSCTPEVHAIVMCAT